MGIAGDMLVAALLELMDDKQAIMRELQLNVPKCVVLSAETVNKCGICGTHFTVNIDGCEEGGHIRAHGRSMAEVSSIIDKLDLPEKIKKDVAAIYENIARAESEVHGQPVEHIHFHEVGSLDAIADITCAAILIDKLGADKIVFSPIHLGSGFVKCAHGILPVPAPATAKLLSGLPVYNDGVEGELCTTTGAALAAYYANSFGNFPLMKPVKTGYGMGKKDFGRANCVRAFLGVAEKICDSEVAELNCNIDDMTGEAMGFAVEKLMTEGALDAYVTAVQMKKNRSGMQLTCLSEKEDAEKFAALIFRHTTTLGIRMTVSKRFKLSRESFIEETPFGEVRYKKSEGFGVTRCKPEYDDVAKIARDRKLSIEEVLNLIKK